MTDHYAMMLINELRTMNQHLQQLQRAVSKLDDIASQIRRK